jgi:hypothetical protein
MTPAHLIHRLRMYDTFASTSSPILVELIASGDQVGLACEEGVPSIAGFLLPDTGASKNRPPLATTA